MARVTIFGPNLNDQSKGQFHVHAAGCADLRRHASREPEYRNGWTIDAADRLTVADEVYADMIDEREDAKPDDYLDDFHFFPCCSDLPERATAATVELTVTLTFDHPVNPALVEDDVRHALTHATPASPLVALSAREVKVEVRSA